MFTANLRNKHWMDKKIQCL